MQTPGSESSPELALQACQSCKSRKRRCDKTLPGCSACAKRGQRCKYRRAEALAPPDKTTPTERTWHASSLADAQPSDDHALSFASLLFLDPSFLQHGQLETTLSTVTAPPHILHLLGDPGEVRATTDRFFQHTHKWMPFISKKRCHDVYLQPGHVTRPDVVLLLLAVKLITTIPPTGERGPRTSLYHTVKHSYTEIESVLSIQVLQAGVLVALYELGHGMYPTAYLSIGTCARYAQALGINLGRAAMVPSRGVLTLGEVEEHRRVWWAIVILDRFVNIGCPGRRLATADPSLEDPLPADDEAWDQGIIRPEDLSTVSSPMPGHMSRFSLLCQAARLLGQVLHYRSHECARHDDGRWMQLDCTLESMLNAALNAYDPNHDQIAFVYSAFVALHAPCLNAAQGPEPPTEQSRRAQAVLEQITNRISANLVEGQCFVGRDLEDMAPWGLYFAYKVCGAHLCVPKKTPHVVTVITNLREAFRAIDARWKVAGAYLQLLEAQEAACLQGLR